MDVTENDLVEVADMCVDFYNDDAEHLRSIILYGGAAKNFVGRDHTPGDYDLNMFFSKKADVSYTVGRPKIIGDYDGLKVEVMRNKVPEEQSVEEYVMEKTSKRWDRIRSEPVVQVYPEVERLDWE